MDAIFSKNKKLAAEVAIAHVDTLEKMNLLNAQIRDLEEKRAVIANERAVLRAFLCWEDDIEIWENMLKRIENKTELIQKIEKAIFPKNPHS
jgi:hypothetical protein